MNALYDYWTLLISDLFFIRLLPPIVTVLTLTLLHCILSFYFYGFFFCKRACVNSFATKSANTVCVCVWVCVEKRFQH